MSRALKGISVCFCAKVIYDGAMFVIFGFGPRTKVIEEGEFHCPVDGGQRSYAQKQVSQWFTLFFIPIFRWGKSEDYVECKSCGTRYPSDVLLV